jgi:hypothetical protein
LPQLGFRGSVVCAALEFIEHERRLNHFVLLPELERILSSANGVEARPFSAKY